MGPIQIETECDELCSSLVKGVISQREEDRGEDGGKEREAETTGFSG